jgi:hypothetical protein
MISREEISKSLHYGNEDDDWDAACAKATLDVLLDIRDLLVEISRSK